MSKIQYTPYQATITALGIFIKLFVVGKAMGIYMNAIHFLSTGSSDCIILESGGKVAMIDAAEDTEYPKKFHDYIVYSKPPQEVSLYHKVPRFL